MTDAQATSRRGLLRAAAGATAVGAGAGSAAGQEGGGGQTTVDMTNDLVFKPAEVTIPPGTTVVWKNVGTVGHTVTAYADEIPSDAEYFASGGGTSEQAARDAFFADGQGEIAGGETYQHTFTVTGDYGYFCIPHENAGMTGTLTVKEGASLPGQGSDGGGGGGDEGPPPVPESARTLGVATTFALLSTLGLAYVFLKYAGGPAPADEE